MRNTPPTGPHDSRQAPESPGQKRHAPRGDGKSLTHGLATTPTLGSETLDSIRCLLWIVTMHDLNHCPRRPKNRVLRRVWRLPRIPCNC